MGLKFSSFAELLEKTKENSLPRSKYLLVSRITEYGTKYMGDWQTVHDLARNILHGMF